MMRLHDLQDLRLSTRIAIAVLPVVLAVGVPTAFIKQGRLRDACI